MHKPFFRCNKDNAPMDAHDEYNNKSVGLCDISFEYDNDEFETLFEIYEEFVASGGIEQHPFLSVVYPLRDANDPAGLVNPQPGEEDEWLCGYQFQRDATDGDEGNTTFTRTTTSTYDNLESFNADFQRRVQRTASAYEKQTSSSSTIETDWALDGRQSFGQSGYSFQCDEDICS
jgi:hypothetical protein